MNNSYIKLFEDFNQKSLPSLIKKISYIIRKDIINNGNNSYNKEYNIDGIHINLIVDYKKSYKQPYYSNVNIYDVISGKEPIDIKVIVNDLKIDVDYLMSIISHEIRHIYDVYTVVDDTEMLDFVKSIAVFKNKNRNEFVNLVYLSLAHELIARNNMLYELYRYINITDKDKLYEIFKKSYVFKALEDLKNFNANLFISKNVDLYEFTLNFSKDIGDDFDGDLKKYYSKWEEFFHKKSDEFLGYVDNMLDDIINDIKNNKIYERLCGFVSYNEDISNKVSFKIFENMKKYKNNL
jgi:hypothetical protein